MQGQACAWLGHWYNEVAQEYGKARNCYAQALQLEPSSSVIGELPQLCMCTGMLFVCVQKVVFMRCVPCSWSLAVLSWVGCPAVGSGFRFRGSGFANQSCSARCKPCGWSSAAQSWMMSNTYAHAAQKLQELQRKLPAVSSYS